MENYVGEGGEEEEIDEREVEGDKGEEDDEDEGDTDKRTLEARSSGSPGNGHARSFILLKMWIVNNFLPMMMVNIFKNMRDYYQIPDHNRFVSLRNLRSATQGRLRTSACTMLCLHQD